jgi:starch synthase
MGLQGLLAARRDALHGILNGIDSALWNPATDASIPERYDAATLARKAGNKHALQARFALEPIPEVLLLGAVGRLTEQKGFDLLADVVDTVLAMPAQIIVVGTGDRGLEHRLRALAAAHPRRVGCHIGFDETLAHLVEAGADAFLMPSRFEPSGMNQMYSQRYGTPPIVHATGGLLDSVVDCTPRTLADGTATGFMFFAPTAGALTGAIERCAAAFRDPAVWRALQRNGMGRDFGWDAAAREYAAIYTRLLYR